MNFNDFKYELEEWLDGHECSVERCTVPDFDWCGRPIDRPIDSCAVFAPVNRWKFPIAFIDSEFIVH